MQTGLADRPVWRDVVFVAVIVLVSVISSVVITLIMIGWEPMALIPSILIPFSVSLPASLYLVRLRRRIETLNRQLLELARRDHLTGLLNRGAFEADVTAARQGGALVLIDADRFKNINDRFGHHAGDFVLRQIAMQIVGALPPGAVAGRLGGEEFGIFLPGADLETGHARADALRAAIADRVYSHEDRIVDVTISAGVAHLPEGVAMDLPLRLADRALYRAKEEGRNLVRLARPGEGSAPPGAGHSPQP